MKRHLLSRDGEQRVIGAMHTGITVSDIDRSVGFYCDLLGLELESRSTAAPYVNRLLKIPGLRSLQIANMVVPGSEHRVELLQYEVPDRQPARSRPCDPANVHLCLYVDDIEGLLSKLAAAGYPSRAGRFLRIPQGRNKGSRVAYVADPDGCYVELFERPGSRRSEFQNGVRS